MIRKALAIVLAKIVRFILRAIKKGGTTLPGKIAYKIDPQIIRKLAKDKTIITVTGTNGKTTTSHMISDMLNFMGYDVITNISGANLQSGIATTLICGRSEMKRTSIKNPKGIIYVLENDEAAFSRIGEDLAPKVSIVTNLFRDQLDRYGELTHTRDMILKGIINTKAKAILCGDDSLVKSIGDSLGERAIYFGTNKDSMLENSRKYPSRNSIIPAEPDAMYCPKCNVKYKFDCSLFAHLGSYYCPSCGSSNPILNYSVSFDLGDNPAKEGFKFMLYSCALNKEGEVELKVPGIHNIYNTVAAMASVIEVLDGNEQEQIFDDVLKSQEKVEAAFGRMEKIDINGKKICILLVKNPAGLDRALSFVESAEDKSSMMMLLNSNFADGKDVSWIWDVDIEARAEGLPKTIAVSGQRYGDMMLRLKYAGLDVYKAEGEASMMKLLEELIDMASEGECVYVLPNYTAMLALRDKLQSELGLKEFWE